MLVCVQKGKEAEIEKIFSKWDLNAVVIGKVTEDGLVKVRDKGQIVAEIEAEALTEAPKYDMEYREPKHIDALKKLDLSSIEEPEDYNRVLKLLLSSPSICSKRWVYEQYDHMVQTNTVVLPGSDASVLRIKGKDKAIAATTDCNSRYCFLNPYRGAQIAVAEAARNLSCSGAKPAAVTDCLNFGNPEKPGRFWEFKNCVEGIADACKEFNTPVVSGNVSFYNEGPQGPIYPTPTIGMIGIIDDLSCISTQYFKQDGDLIILLGVSGEELGASEYLKQVYNLVRGEVPYLDIDLEKRVQNSVLEMIADKLVQSAHDCSEGGLAVAIAESCISGSKTIGADIRFSSKIRLDALLFGETQSRIVVSCLIL